MSSTCLHNMVNFGLLAAEIVSLVWGTPANFNGFRVLAALRHGSQVVSLSSRTDPYSFYHRTIIDWNALPTSVKSLPGIHSIRCAIHSSLTNSI